jgi:hypothetical protein
MDNYRRMGPRGLDAWIAEHGVEAPRRAFAASRLAHTKHVVEAPLLRAMRDLDGDTSQNLALHQRIHEAFAQGAEWAGVDGFVEWIYAELFEMPLGDAALGLDAPDPFADGRIRGYGANTAIQPPSDVGPVN